MSALDPHDYREYLSRLSPFSRSPTIKPSTGKEGEPEPLLKQQQGADHVIGQRHRLSLRRYPRDCPPLRPHWFHAVDAPKRRPNPAGQGAQPEKPPGVPKKYAPFSVRDSKAIEAAYRKLGEDERPGKDEEGADISAQKTESQKYDTRTGAKDDLKPGRVRVPVNEDYLFDVDIERRELGPTYWLGPVYDVRRGTWFYQDGIIQRPCDESLSNQLEDGYLKTKAWKIPTQQSTQKPRSSSQPRRPTSWTPTLAVEDTAKASVSVPITPKGSNPDLRKLAVEPTKTPERKPEPEQAPEESMQNTYRLFGTHMNSVVTYQDSTTAWLITDDFMSRMNYTMYQRFAGGGHFGGVKITRGYIQQAKKPDAKDEKAADGKQTADKPSEQDGPENEAPEELQERQSTSEIRRMKLERHMSSLLEDPSSEDLAKQEEEVRKRDEREMEEDYREQEGEDPGREIEHLILVTHGIGQRLGLRIESVNFVHDVNTFRKTIKAVYADSPDLRALNAELDSAEAVNSRIQVLPICWRHLLDFPKQSLKHNRKEHDLGDTEYDDEDYPSLDDISVEGVPAVRNLITDLALDILLYQSPAYKNHISRIVLEECNRIYHLFMDRNPEFKGKVSLVGHSLGSAIMFDLLCLQGQQGHSSKRHDKDHHLKFDFAVEDFYALGSPIGLFQMLKGRTIVGRQATDSAKHAFGTSMDDPMLDAPSHKRARSITNNQVPGEAPVSSPKCAQIFNIFHPTDPISYRIEPLISQSMSSLKPQPLPYTKRGIFGAPMGQGLTGIGARVTQSVSSMWSNVASNLLTRGLGYSGNEPIQLPTVGNGNKGTGPLSIGAPTPKAPLPAKGVEIAKVADEVQNAGTTDSTADGQQPPTLIDSEMETLFSGFSKRRKSAESDASNRDLGSNDPDWQSVEERDRRLRREEDKVRRLNANGRVDYAIQEGAFDINLIAAIASHLSYWSDEDVSHFVVSQLLSRHRVVRPNSSAGA